MSSLSEHFPGLAGAHTSLMAKFLTVLHVVQKQHSIDACIDNGIFTRSGGITELRYSLRYSLYELGSLLSQN